MTGNKKALLTKVCTFCMCFFSLFSLGAAALAWFTNNKVVKNEGISTNVDLTDIHARYYVYKFSKLQNFAGTDLDESTQEHIDAEDKLTITNFALNTYDTIFINENQYTPALIRIHLYGKDLPDASAGNPQNLSIRIKRNTGFVEQDETISDPFLYKCITNVANFTLSVPSLTSYDNYLTNTSDLNSISNIDTFFKDTVSSFKNNAGSNPGVTFFETVESVTTKKSLLTLTTQYTETRKIENEDNEMVNHIVLYLYVDYNLTLLQNFTGSESVNIDRDGLGQIDVQLLNDLSSVEVKILDE